MARGLCIERLRAHHERLLAERDACYTGDAPKGEIAPWVARRLESDLFEERAGTTAASNDASGTRRLLDIWHDISSLYIEFDVAVRREEDDFRERIIRLLETFRYPIPTRVIAGVLGCSSGHARRFYWDDNETRVREKRWSERQRREQAPPDLVDQIRRRDGSECIRCGGEQNLQIHHIQPVSQGGTATERNLATLCSDCHQAAHLGYVSSGEVAYATEAEFWCWVEGGEKNYSDSSES